MGLKPTGVGMIFIRMTNTSTVGKRSQTVVPLEIRRRHGITTGTTLEWTDQGTHIRIVKLSPPSTRAKLVRKAGYLMLSTDRPVTAEETRRAIEEHAL